MAVTELSFDGSPKLWALSSDCELIAYDASHSPALDWVDPVALSLSPTEADDFLARHGIVDAFRAALRRPDAQVLAPRYIIDGDERAPARTDEVTNTARKVGRAALRDLLAMGEPYQPTTYWVTTLDGIWPDPDTAALVVPDWGASGTPEAYRSVGARVDVAAEPWFLDVRTQVQAKGVDRISRLVLLEDAKPKWSLAIRPIWPEWIEQNGTVVLP